jgi:transposase
VASAFRAQLVREAFVRCFANGKALGSYACLAPSPYSSGGIDREQGIGKAGNRRVRTVMVELAWLWTRYQPGAARSAGSANGLDQQGGVFANHGLVE